MRKHWISVISRMRLAMTLGMTILGIGVSFVFNLSIWLSIGVLVHQCFLFYCFIAWRLERIDLTEYSLIWTSGVFVIEKKELLLREITDSRVVQNLFGRWLDYGTIWLEYEGREEGQGRKLTYVSRPDEMLRAIERRRDGEVLV